MRHGRTEHNAGVGFKRYLRFQSRAKRSDVTFRNLRSDLQARNIADRRNRTRCRNLRSDFKRCFNNAAVDRSENGTQRIIAARLGRIDASDHVSPPDGRAERYVRTHDFSADIGIHGNGVHRFNVAVRVDIVMQRRRCRNLRAHGQNRLRRRPPAHNCRTPHTVDSINDDTQSRSKYNDYDHRRFFHNIILLIDLKNRTERRAYTQD